jgi:RNA polymerase sigma factor (sigma-70 family)
MGKVMATAKKKAQYMMDYRQREVLLSMGLSPLSGSIPWPLLDVEETTTETVDPETIEALIDRETPEDVVQLKELEADMEYLLDSLTPREKKVLKLRFGIGLPKDYTLEEVGSLMGVTKERVRQMEAKALRKMRHPTRSDILIDYLEGMEYRGSHIDVKERFWKSQVKPPHPDEVEWWTHTDWMLYWEKKKRIDETLARVQVEKQAELERLRMVIKSGTTNFRGED